MAASRPMWKGQLRLSLVSINVEMFTAHKSGATASFNQIHKPSGKRVHYQKVVDGIGPVEAEDIKKGYQYEKGEYVLLEDEELDAVKLETKKTLDLVQFVDEGEIPPLYFDTPYFMAPVDELAEDAFRVIRDALRETKKMGIGKLAIRGREYLAAIRPCGKGLLLETLRFEAEVRKAETYFRDIGDKPPPAELLEVAKQLIARKVAPFDPAAFKDTYAKALRELVDRKLKSRGRKIKADKDERQTGGAQVIDLMGALKRSLESSGGDKTGGAKAKSKPPAKKSAARKKKSA